MTMLIRANEGAGLVSLGMTRAAVRSMLKDETPRPKPSDTAVPSDYFVTHGVIVHYDDDGVVEAIELGQAAEPMFLERTLVGEPFSAVVRWFRSQDPRVEIDEAGLTSYRFGVGVFAPHAVKSPDDPVEGVIVFRPGYYG